MIIDVFLYFVFCHFRVWEAGGFASKGLTEVAKWGSPRVLESELKVNKIVYIDQLLTIIKGRVSAHQDDH